VLFVTQARASSPTPARPPAAAPPSLCFCFRCVFQIDSCYASRTSSPVGCRRLLAPKATGARAKTAPAGMPNVKHTASLRGVRPCIKACCRLVCNQALQGHPLLGLTALPAGIHSLRFWRSGPVRAIGRHVDNANGGGAIDLSFTLFLFEP